MRKMNDATKKFRGLLFDLLEEHKVEVEVIDGNIEFWSYAQYDSDNDVSRECIDMKMPLYLPSRSYPIVKK